MLSLARFKSEEPGMADLLPYAALVADGVVLCKDGSLLAGFTFRGEDAASSTKAEKNQITLLVNKYLHRFDAGWCLWVEAARLPSPGYSAPEKSHFPDPITALIDAERREMFERQDTHYETEYSLFLQYKPPLSSVSKLKEKFYNKDTEIALGDRLLEEFQARLAELEGGLAQPLKMRRMGSAYVTVDGEQYESRPSEAMAGSSVPAAMAGPAQSKHSAIMRRIRSSRRALTGAVSCQALAFRDLRIRNNARYRSAEGPCRSACTERHTQCQGKPQARHKIRKCLCSC